MKRFHALRCNPQRIRDGDPDPAGADIQTKYAVGRVGSSRHARIIRSSRAYRRVRGGS
jgi:hypothetical protein